MCDESQGFKLPDLHAAAPSVHFEKQMSVLDVLEHLPSLRRLALRGCHLRYGAVMEVAEHAPLLQVLIIF